MSLVDLILRPWVQTGKWTLSNLVIAAGGSATTTLLVAQGAGRRIVVCDGNVNGPGAGATTWYHTAVAAENRLSGTLNQTNNSSYRPGPWVLPPNTPLIVVTVTSALNGWATIAIVEDE